MRISLRATCALVAVLAIASPAEAQQGRAGFAVLRFEDGGSYGQDKADFRALELGIPELLGTRLSRHPDVRVVERGPLAQAMRAHSLRPSQRVDAATASRIAKGAGARYAVTGSFADFYGKFRINARVVDAETGQILKVVSNDDPALQDRAQLSAIIESVSEKIVAAVGLPPYPAAGGHATVPADAITMYSRGLLLESQTDRSHAAEEYQRALTASPGFDAAREGLQRVR
ncbi:MAG: hypothetical protein H0T44_14820 [Gemmatimonadales bacterium]|nr:hypothetical protein [Gemmatimonadales bacterium]MDQ3428003.1 CsgG/HfaB family protein [Gemmatimonadota bacterium]